MWIALAEAQQQLGLDISDEQLDELRAHAGAEHIDFDAAAAHEKRLRHDVMAHIHTYGDQCPKARPIIHLGATSCYVVDNTELIQMREALVLVRAKLVRLVAALAAFAKQHRALPTLGFTHYQPAQLVTVGKRATLWLQDFTLDLDRLERELAALPLRGVKGTTGTQASFLSLFDGDHAKVERLNELVVGSLGGGFSRAVPVSGQTYTRKLDFFVLSALSGIAQSAHKMACDVRLLANLKECEEPFGKNQVGSSAMAYKRNPMRSERICSLARFVMSLTANAANTHATQWFERSLDDSANRRLILPEAFLGTDVVLNIAHNVISGLQLWPNVIRAHIMAELPFMATENILMACVKAGGDRQELHEAIREHSMAAGRRVKVDGAANDLLERIAGDARFAAVHGTLDSLMDPVNFIGRCPEQVDAFLGEEVAPILARHAGLLGEGDGASNELNV